MSWVENGWYNKSKRNYWLLPLSGLFYLLYRIRLGLFKSGLIKSKRSAVPVMVVGNITVGGTGKTPFVVYLIKLLQQQGYKPGIVSRGYGAKVDSQVPFPRLITQNMDIRLSGDEPKLLFESTGVPVVISPKRPDGIDYLVKNCGVDFIVSDDGLQHYQMARDIEIAIIDAARCVGNGWVLPVGPLREPQSRLNRVDLAVYNHGFEAKGEYFQQAGTIRSLTGKVEPNINTLTKVHLVSGIGNPSRFEKTVQGLGLTIASVNWFADHHPFSADDFSQYGDNDLVLMTEKDAVKCRSFARDNMFVLPIVAVISPQLEKQLLALIAKTNKKTS